MHIQLFLIVMNMYTTLILQFHIYIYNFIIFKNHYTQLFYYLYVMAAVCWYAALLYP